METEEINCQENNKPNHIVIITFMILFILFSPFYSLISSVFIVDHNLMFIGEWFSKLVTSLLNKIGEGLNLGWNALILYYPLKWLLTIFIGGFWGGILGILLEARLNTKKNQIRIVIISIFVFIIYHLVITIYLFQTSDLSIKKIPIDKQYRIEIDRIEGDYRNNSLWVGYRIFKDSEPQKPISMDIRILKQNKELKPKMFLDYNSQFEYIKPPFVIRVGKITLEQEKGSTTITLPVDQDIRIRKIVESN